jgi:hypothetical protein
MEFTTGTGHPSAGLVCAFNNSSVFDVRHSRILLARGSVLRLTRINAKRLRTVPPFVVAVRRPISPDWNVENKLPNVS